MAKLELALAEEHPIIVTNKLFLPLILEIVIIAAPVKAVPPEFNSV